MKTAIIGGGICGLYLAKNLAQKGIQTTVFERKKNIGKICCSGLFSERLFEHLPQAKPLAVNIIRKAIINFPKRRIELVFKQPFFIINHFQLDNLAADLASKAGASIISGETVDGAKLKELTQNYERIIGADGAFSAVRKYLALPNPEFWLGIQFFEKKYDTSDSVETWATKNGFLWRIPRGNEVEWGIMEKPASARKLFDKFIAQQGLKPDKLVSAVIPQGFTLPKNNKFTLCGDASGLTKPWSGGGVLWGLKQADILLKNFPNFIQYKQEAQSFFRLKIIVGKAAKSAAYTAGFNFGFLIPRKINLDGDFLFKFSKK